MVKAEEAPINIIAPPSIQIDSGKLIIGRLNPKNINPIIITGRRPDLSEICPANGEVPLKDRTVRVKIPASYTCVTSNLLVISRGMIGSSIVKLLAPKIITPTI